MSSRFSTLIATATIVLAQVSAHAGDNPPAKDTRILYVVKYVDASQLAEAIGNQFKSDVQIDVLQTLSANCLSIHGDSTVVQNVMKLVDQIDQRAKSISVELIVADVPATKGDDGKLKATEIDLKELTGTTKEVLEKLDGLRKKGVIDGIRSIQLTVLENQRSWMDFGASKPFVGFVLDVRNRREKHFSRALVGTYADMTARLTPDKDVLLELNLEDNRIQDADDGSDLGKDDNGLLIPATEELAAKVESKITIAPDHAKVVEGVKTKSKSGKAQTIVIVAARLVDDAKGSK